MKLFSSGGYLGYASCFRLVFSFCIHIFRRGTSLSNFWYVVVSRMRDQTQNSFLIMMSSHPVTSPSPEQGKPKDCDSKVSDEILLPATGITAKRGRTKSGNICHTRSMKFDQCEEVRAVQAKLVDELSCLYCQREFESQRGLSIHLLHCKNRQVFNDLPTCSVIVEPLPEVIVVSEGESENVSNPAELFCLPLFSLGFSLACSWYLGAFFIK